MCTKDQRSRTEQQRASCTLLSSSGLHTTSVKSSRLCAHQEPQAKAGPLKSLRPHLRSIPLPNVANPALLQKLDKFSCPSCFKPNYATGKSLRTCARRHFKQHPPAHYHHIHDSRRNCHPEFSRQHMALHRAYGSRMVVQECQPRHSDHFSERNLKTLNRTQPPFWGAAPGHLDRIFSHKHGPNNKRGFSKQSKCPTL